MHVQGTGFRVLGGTHQRIRKHQQQTRHHATTTGHARRRRRRSGRRKKRRRRESGRREGNGGRKRRRVTPHRGGGGGVGGKISCGRRKDPRRVPPLSFHIPLLTLFFFFFVHVLTVPFSSSSSLVGMPMRSLAFFLLSSSSSVVFVFFFSCFTGWRGRRGGGKNEWKQRTNRDDVALPVAKQLSIFPTRQLLPQLQIGQERRRRRERKQQRIKGRVSNTRTRRFCGWGKENGRTLRIRLEKRTPDRFLQPLSFHQRFDKKHKVTKEGVKRRGEGGDGEEGWWRGGDILLFGCFCISPLHLHFHLGGGWEKKGHGDSQQPGSRHPSPCRMHRSRLFFSSSLFFLWWWWWPRWRQEGCGGYRDGSGGLKGHSFAHRRHVLLLLLPSTLPPAVLSFVFHGKRRRWWWGGVGRPHHFRGPLETRRRRGKKGRITAADGPHGRPLPRHRPGRRRRREGGRGRPHGARDP